MAKTTTRLIGIQSLPQSTLNFDWTEYANEVSTCLSILDNDSLAGFPADARIQVALRENKKINIADFGTLDSLDPVVQIGEITFTSPSSELSIVLSQSDGEEHLLLRATGCPRLRTKAVLKASFISK